MLEAGLRRRGLSPGDVDVLVRQESLLRVRGGRGTPSAFVAEALPARARDVVLEVVLDALAAGPHGLFEHAWRRLFAAGCPLDHLWCTLWHAFKDPAADYQDEVWLDEAVGIANVERYVALGVPRLQMPAMYGPGLGAETLLRNADDGVRALVRLDGPPTAIGHGLEAARVSLSRRARDQVDDIAGVPAGARMARPPDEALAAIGAKLVDGRKLSRADRRTLAFLHRSPAHEDLLLLDDEVIPSLAVAWLDAARRLLRSGDVVFDAGLDRHRLAAEPETPLVRPPPRRPPAGPTPRPADLTSLLAPHEPPADAFAPLPSVHALETEDPLRWLEALAHSLATAS